MNKNLFIFALVLLVLIVAAYFTLRGNLQLFTRNNAEVTLKGQTVQLEIADDDAEREKGLSGREELAKNQGMIFLFDRPGTYQFWMKDMKIPLDILFLHDNKIVTIYENVPAYADVAKKIPNTILYSPSAPANRVIELNAGLVEELGVKEGDTVEINL